MIKSTIVSLIGSRVLLACDVVVLGAHLARPARRRPRGLCSGLHRADLGSEVQLPRNEHHRDPAQRQPRLPGAWIVFALVDIVVAVFVAVTMGGLASAGPGDSSPPDQPPPEPVPQQAGEAAEMLVAP